MLLVPAAFAAPILVVRTAGLVGAGEAGTLELRNIGDAPATVRVSVEGQLELDRTSVSVPPGQTLELPYRSTMEPAKCSSSMGWCVEETLLLSSDAGAVYHHVRVVGPHIGVLASAGDLVYWNPAGPPTRTWGLGVRPVASDETPLYGKVTPTATAHGRWFVQVFYVKGSDEPGVVRLGQAAVGLAGACGEADAHAVEGSLAWGSDGRISGLSFKEGTPTATECVVRGWMGVKAGTREGSASFHLRPSPPPTEALFSIATPIQLAATARAQDIPVRNLGSRFLRMEPIGSPELRAEDGLIRAGETGSLRLTWKGACTPGADPCARTALKLGGINGILEVPVEVGAGAPSEPSRLYWNPSGPPPDRNVQLPSFDAEIRGGPWRGLVTGLQASRSDWLGGLEPVVTACMATAGPGRWDARAWWAADGAVELVELRPGEDDPVGRCLAAGIFTLHPPAEAGGLAFWVETGE